MTTSSTSVAACDRFFAIPELVAELAACLDANSLHRMMLTSRRMHSFCEPSLYHSVVLNSLDRCSFERIASLDYLGALVRNIHHVKSLNSGLLFAVYQFHCMLAFQQQEREQGREQQEQKEAADSSYSRTTAGASTASLSALGLLPLPEWTPLPDLPSSKMELILLPPMCNLTHFKMNFDRLIHHRLHRAYLPSYDRRSRSIQQVAWVLRQSPHLVDIDMYHIDLKSIRDIQALPTVIHGLVKLRKFRIRIALPRPEWAFLGSTLFFCCPPSLRHLKIEMYYNGSSNNGGDPELFTISPTPPRRQEPLRELRSFYIQEVLSRTTEEYLSHFQHCPALEELHISKFSRTSMNFTTITQFIATHCPKLHSLTQDSYQPGSLTPLSLRIMEIMTPQMLQKLVCIQYIEGLSSPHEYSILFRRHSTTLRRLELSPCWSIKSTTLRTILCECQALQAFVLVQAETPNHCGIDLVDAVAAPWACTSLVRLFLVVNLLDCRERSSSFTAVAGHGDEDNMGYDHRVETMVTEGWKPYYAREAPIVLTAKEEEQFRLLEMFYRQLGSLTQLEFLSLKVQLDTDFTQTQEAEDDNGVEEPWLNYQRNSLPGMLSLGDDKSNRPGFLHLLSGWKNLSCLYGSVALDAAETRRTVGLADMQFMVAQWPNLSQAEFMLTIEEDDDDDDDGDEAEQGQSALEWLQESRPDIEIIL
ncbi:hypothetical protein BGW39_002306 [Mortierella sp. 14UC]|nr:hypothetical protein BGW39_002306 [Mortierella sp. 14UC]